MNGPTEEDLPDNCLRGLSSKAHVHPDGLISSDAFRFDSGGARSDGYTECSVNWEDDADAVTYSLGLRGSDNRPLYAAGIAVLPRKELHKIMRKLTLADALSYERQRQPDNKYHGNLLLLDALDRAAKSHIREAVAYASTLTPR